eukprot:TRINITY_DN34919_c0_g1_i1.p1 TRINITY_DN34919_c0_g1~~TRINITY_DN34919_c0_g1_i1.p1  ORF type:complete len:123 (+),score=6.62 TRINITY_DN34919_c0_g1_i1:167-535(+)
MWISWVVMRGTCNSKFNSRAEWCMALGAGLVKKPPWAPPPFPFVDWDDCCWDIRHEPRRYPQLRPDPCPGFWEGASPLTRTLAARAATEGVVRTCLLYTSDAADEEDSVDFGGRRIIKKNKI